MNTLTKALFKGISGKTYPFEMYNLETVFQSGIGGVYVFATRYKGGDRFIIEPKFIGETDDFVLKLSGYHPQQKCLQKCGVNCKGIYKLSDPEQRTVIMQDLIDQYEPDCNFI